MNATARAATARRLTPARWALVLIVGLSMLTLGLPLGPQSAEAGGPPYSGPVTQATGPAYFGPAPNPVPYCENPTYFDPFPENVNPIGSIDVGDTAQVTTDNIDMTFELTAEGDPGGQYPGFFPDGVQSTDPNDQPKGVEMASGDAATITLSEPLFYTQWVFTDVDRENEGFDVTPQWTDAANPGAVAVFGGDATFEFSGTTNTLAQFNDTNTVGEDSESLNGRVQVDLLGAVNGISITRDPGSGQSGFAVGGGCSPVGIAKELTSGPTWNGTSFDATYTIRVRNNLPSTATLQADIDAARAAAASSSDPALGGDPVGIDLTDLALSDLLTDSAFGTITVVDLSNTSTNILENENYDGINDTALIAAGQVIPPETEEEFVLILEYTPDAAGPLGDGCAAQYTVENQAIVSGTASGVAVQDESDEGADPDPGVDNGAGGVDDPTLVVFDCPPVDPDVPSIALSKTVIDGVSTCDTAVEGTDELVSGAAGDAIIWCFVVTNDGDTPLTNILFDDPLANLADVDVLATYGGGAAALLPGESISFELASTIPAGGATNVATVEGSPSAADGTPTGDPAVNDQNDAAVEATAAPSIALSKTVVDGASTCDAAVEGTDELVSGTVGSAIIWCFVVTNDGETALTNILFDDPLANLADVDVLATYGGGAAALLPGESISFELADTIPLGTTTNTASVDGTPSADDGTPTGDPVVSDQNDAAIEGTGTPSIELAKTVASGADADCATAVDQLDAEAGTPVTYCFTVTNTGDVSLLVSEIVDADLGITVPIPVAEQIIAPAGSVTVSVNDVARDIVNTASVTGTPVDPDGNPLPGLTPPTAEDPAEVAAFSPELDIVKTVVPGPSGTCPATFADGVAGDGTALAVELAGTVTYCLNVINSGDIAIDNVVVSDSQAPSDFTVGTLAVGEEFSVSYDVVVRSDTPVQNTAIVGGDNPFGGELPPVGDTAVIDPPPPLPDIALTKTVIDQRLGCEFAEEGVWERIVADVGLPIVWCFTVTNTGNVPLANVIFNDPPAGLAGIDVLDEYTDQDVLLVGETVAFELPTTVPAVEFNNVADVTGEAAEFDGTIIVGIDPVTDENDASVGPTPPPPPPPLVGYPGPFTPEEPPAPPATVPLAVTGTTSAVLTSAAMAAIATGGALVVIRRRTQDDASA